MSRMKPTRLDAERSSHPRVERQGLSVESLGHATSMTDTLTIVDNRTGKKYELPIQDGTIRAMNLRQIKAAPEDFGLRNRLPDPLWRRTGTGSGSSTGELGHRRARSARHRRATAACGVLTRSLS